MDLSFYSLKQILSKKAGKTRLKVLCSFILLLQILAQIHNKTLITTTQGASFLHVFAFITT